MRLTVGSGAGKGRSVPVEGERFLIGSSDECRLTIRDPKVDPRHACLQVHDDGRVDVHDLDSRHGTFVDGARVNGSRRLRGGEVVRLGDTVLLTALEGPQPERAAGQRGSGAAVEVEIEFPDRVPAERQFVEPLPVARRRRLGLSTPALAAAAAALLLVVAAIVALAAGWL